VDSRALSIIEKEAMAPCTYVELALGVASSGPIRFGSLKFADINGPAPKDDLLLSKALCFRDLDFMAYRLGQLRLSEENVASPHISMPDHGPAQEGPTIVDSDALACRVDAYLRANLEPELIRRVFYMLANAFAQLSRGGPLLPEAKFWNPSTPLPSKMRDVIALFEQELARRNSRTMTLDSPRFMGMMERDPESLYDLLLATPKNTDSESDFEGSCHSPRECNMLHLSKDGAAPAEDAEDDAYPIPHTPRE
jgi:hypothetical protein